MAKKRGKIVKAVSNMFQDATTMFWRILTIVISVFTLFIIGRSAVSIVKSRVEIHRLERQKAKYLESIAADSTIIEQLKYNEYLERFAREKFNMQRKGERVYIIEE